MKNIFIGLLFLAFTNPVFSHEYYISICNINYNKADAILEISLRVFTDDIEKAIEEQSTEKLRLASETQNEKFNLLFEKYLRNNLMVATNDSALHFEYLGSEVDIENVWCYLQISNIKKLENLYIENNVLFSTYPEQINLINFSKNEIKKSATLSTALPSIMFEF